VLLLLLESDRFLLLIKSAAETRLVDVDKRCSDKLAKEVLYAVRAVIVVTWRGYFSGRLGRY